MKILLATIGRYPHVGGKSTHIQTLSDGLLSLGVDASVISASTLNPLRRALVSDIPRVILDGISKGKGLYWSYRARAAMLADTAEQHRLDLGGIDIFHAHDAPAMDILGRLRRLHPGRWLRVPSVLTVHGDATNEYLSEGKANPNSAAAAMLFEQERKAYSTADAVITVDNRLHDHVRNVSPGANICIFPNTVDTDLYTKGLPLPGLRHSLNIRDDAFIVLCPRRLVPKNGVIVAIKALKFLSDRFIHFSGTYPYLICAGDGPERPFLEDMARNLGIGDRVKFVGSIPHEHMLDYYNLSDAVVIPSVTSKGVIEATSISALEGMSCGLPVIASDIGGLSQLIRHGDTGFLFPEGDIDVLAQLLNEVISNGILRNAVGSSARSYVEEKHGKAIGNKLVMDLYSSLVSQA